MTRMSRRRFSFTLVGLLWLFITLSILNQLFPMGHASASTCSQADYSAGMARLRISACLDPTIVEPTTPIVLNANLTNLGPTNLTLSWRGFPIGLSGVAFGVDIHNGSGSPVASLGVVYISNSPPDSVLRAGASVSKEIWWINGPNGLNITDSGLFSAQAFISADVRFNNTVLFGLYEVRSPMILYQVIQLTLPLDVFEILVGTLLAVIVIILILLLRELRRFQKSLAHLRDTPNTADVKAGNK